MFQQLATEKSYLVQQKSYAFPAPYHFPFVNYHIFLLIWVSRRGAGSKETLTQHSEIRNAGWPTKTQCEPGFHGKWTKRDATASSGIGCTVHQIRCCGHHAPCSDALQWRPTGLLHPHLVQSASFQIYLLSIAVRRLDLLCKRIVLDLKIQKASFAWSGAHSSFYSQVPSPQLELV